MAVWLLGDYATFAISMLFNPDISLVESQRVGLISEQLILQVPKV